MGLDTTHDCWHGAYSAFMRWRMAIAKAAGFPPLSLMDGFYDGPVKVIAGLGGGFRFEDQEAWLYEFLPIPWDYFASDPLSKLLSHSDCDGEILAEDCEAIASRLVEVLPKLPVGEGGGHIGNWRYKTQQFIDGLRAAAAAGENVEFR